MTPVIHGLLGRAKRRLITVRIGEFEENAMITAILPPPPIHHPVETPTRAISVIRRVQDAVCALPAPTFPQDTLRATTVNDLVSTHVIDARTLAVVARKDRHIQPIAAMITEHLLGVTATVVGSAITGTLG